MPYSDNPQEILKQINPATPPYQIYILAGDEEYFTDKIEKNLVSAYLDEAALDFNYTLYYGNEVTADDIMNACRRAPMMAQRTIVVVREAQELLRKGDSDKGLNGLMPLLNHPNKLNILILAFKQKKPDRRMAFVKGVEKTGLYLESKEVTESKITSYIVPLAHAHGLQLTVEAVQVFAEHVGTDIKRLDSEMEKLAIALRPQEKQMVTPEMVLHYTGLSKEYSAFDLRKALATKNRGRAMKIGLSLANDAKRVPIQMIVPVLFDYFANLLLAFYAENKSQQGIMAELELRAPFMAKDYMAGLQHYNAYRVTQIISYLRRMDARSKGMYSAEGDPQEIMTDMILFILN